MRKLPLLLVGAAASLSLSASPLMLDNPYEGRIQSSLIGKAGDITSIAKSSAPVLTPTRSANTTTNVLVDEDFSLFTAGSESEPDEEFLGIPGEPYIDETLTKQSGWSTNYATQAGGACAFNTFVGGFINTPLGDYSGNITISFRAKRLSQEPVTATLGVLLLFNDIWYPDPIAMEYARIYDYEVDGEGELDENGWKEFSFTFNNDYAGNDAFVQLSAYYCQVLIDDVKVTVEDTGDVSAPQTLPATAFTRDGFTAHWSNVRLAESYLFSLYHENKISEPEYLTYDFNTPSELEGWTLDSPASTTDDMGLEGSPAIVIDSNNYLISPEYAGRLESIKIWMRNIGDQPYFSALVLQGFDGKDWKDVGSIYTEMVLSDNEGSTLLIDGQTRPAFYDVYNKVRFMFRGWDSDNEEGIYPLLVIDHIEVSTLEGKERAYDITNLPVEGTEYVVKDMDPYTDYFYEVAAKRGEKQSWSQPRLAYGISTPIVKAPSEINSDSYTANWEPTPKASLYRVRDLGIYEATEAMSDYAVLDEEFDLEVEGTREEPFFLGNDFTPCSLDEYTLYPGWIGATTIIGDGLLGVGSAGYAYIQTPELTLNNGTGDFTVEITVDILGDDGMLITPSTAQAEYIGFEAAEGFNTVALNYSNGSANETLRIKSQYGTPFYLQSIRVLQNLNAGEKVYTYLQGHVIEGDRENYTFQNVDFNSYTSHAFDVLAIYNRGVSQCVSERSQYSETGVMGGTNLLTKDTASFSVRAGKGTIEIKATDGEFIVTSIDGKQIAHVSVNGSRIVSLPAGVYVVRHGTDSRKLLVK